jgi:hypothetical protein
MAALAASFGSKLEHQRKLAHDRKIVSMLSDRQLKDAGIDRSAISPACPTLEVEASLIMTNLMGLR